MDKKRIHHYWTKFRLLQPAYLFLLFALCLTVSALALRHNNQTMANLREHVYTADRENKDVEGSLRNLREYIYSHMNTSLSSGDNSVYPPLQLKYTYERLTTAAQADAKAANSHIYSQAQAHCEQLYPQSFSGGPRVPCIKQYVTDHGVKVPQVPDSLYKFDFVSPTWSPDLAGWALVATTVTGILLLIRVAVPLVLKKLRVI